MAASHKSGHSPTALRKSRIDRGRVKTSARFHTSLFRSLLRGLKAFRVEKIAKNFALLDRSQNFAEFPHGLGRSYPFGTALRNNRYLRICRRRVSGPRRFVGFDSFHEIVERTDRGSRRDQRISKGGRWIAGTTRLPALTQNARGSNLSPHSQISCGFTYGERDRSEKPPALIGRGFRFAQTLRKYASWV